MRHVRVVLGLTLWVTTGWGCGASGAPTIEASDYDQSCASNRECASVREGDACSTCNCSNAAVNTDVADEYRARYEELRGSCGSMPDVACDCERSVAYCDQDSLCANRTEVFRTPAEFDQSCATDADCVAVTSGEVCATCRCPDAAINVGALEAFRAVGGGVDCGVGELASCAACEATTVACQDSACVVLDR